MVGNITKAVLENLMVTKRPFFYLTGVVETAGLSLSAGDTEFLLSLSLHLIRDKTKKKTDV